MRDRALEEIMKAKTFLILLSILFVLAGVTYVMVDFDPSVPAHSPMGQQLFADLPANSIAAIELIHVDGSVNLSKQNDIWVVEERSGFPADFEKISDLVRRVIEMRIGSSFEILPDMLGPLQLHDPREVLVPEAHKGMRIIFKDAAHQPLLDIIVGKARETTAGSGNYVLPQQSRLGYLVDGNLRRFSRQSPDWIQNKLLDVDPEDIERVVCEDPDSGEVLYTLQRPGPGQDPIWIGGDPEGVQRTFRVDTVFRALANLSVDDVVAPAGIADTLYFENRPRLAYHLYDGTVYHIYPGDPLPDADDRFYFRLQVVTQPASETTRLDSVDASRPHETAVSEEPAPGLNKMMASWVYVIPAWKHGSFVLDPELFMEASQ
jgi:hypothetical protein